MHSILTRGNALVAYTLSVLAGLTFCCFLSTVFSDYRTNTDIQTVQVAVTNVPNFHTREKSDLGSIKFDLKTDLTNLFNWNVKELFLYLTAEYSTPAHEFNQVVVWDKIVRRGENTIIDYKNLNPKYYFWDDGKGLKGHNNITLTLSWNIIPNAGLLPNIMSHGSHSFSFPHEYSKIKA